MIGFLHDDSDQVIDTGPFGYTTGMHVYRNDPADRENLEAGEVTKAYGDFALSAPHRLVGFSSNPGGTGAWQTLLLDEETAERFAVGDEVTFHFRKAKEIGFGTLVAIVSPAVTSTPSP